MARVSHACRGPSARTEREATVGGGERWRAAPSARRSLCSARVRFLRTSAVGSDSSTSSCPHSCTSAGIPTPPIETESMRNSMIVSIGAHVGSPQMTSFTATRSAGLAATLGGSAPFTQPSTRLIAAAFSFFRPTLDGSNIAAASDCGRQAGGAACGFCGRVDATRALRRRGRREDSQTNPTNPPAPPPVERAQRPPCAPPRASRACSRVGQME